MFGIDSLQPLQMSQPQSQGLGHGSGSLGVGSSYSSSSISSQSNQQQQQQQQQQPMESEDEMLTEEKNEYVPYGQLPRSYGITFPRYGQDNGQDTATSTGMSLHGSSSNDNSSENVDDSLDIDVDADDSFEFHGMQGLGSTLGQSNFSNRIRPQGMRIIFTNSSRHVGIIIPS